MEDLEKAKVNLNNLNNISEEEQNKTVLFLNIKISKNNNGIFDKSKIISEKNIIMRDSTYLIINMNNVILKLDMQYKIGDREIILFNIRKNKLCKLEKPVFNNSILTEVNLNALNYFLWYVVRPEVHRLSAPNMINNDYYLNEKDIIRFSNVKLILQEIHIQSNNNKGLSNNSDDKFNTYDIHKINMKKKAPIFNLEPDIELYITKKEDIIMEDKYIICDICNQKTYSEDNPLVKFCLCENFKHYECIKEELKKSYIIKENNEKSSKNYYIKFFCRNKCKAIYPLRFKIKEINRVYNLFDIEKPKNEDYLIFESLPYNRNGEYERSIHIVKITGNNNNNIGNNIEIKIGRDRQEIDNHIKLIEETVSREHAKIIYNKNDGSLLLKNLSKKSESLVLIKDTLIINENTIYLHVGRTAIEASLIKEEDASKQNDLDIIQTKDEYMNEKNKQIIDGNNDDDNNNNIIGFP